MVQLIALNYFNGLVQFSVCTTFSIIAFFFNGQILHFGTINVFELLAGTGTLFSVELLVQTDTLFSIELLVQTDTFFGIELLYFFDFTSGAFSLHW